MAKHKSRAARAGEQGDAWMKIMEDLAGLLEDAGDDFAGMRKDLREKLVESANDLLEKVDFSEFESLKEEMESWRDNMQGTNLESTGKYEEVSESCDELENIDADSLADPVTDPEEIQERIDALDEAAQTLQGVNFPGMF